MKKFFNYLRGTVIVRGEGAFPERLINLCARSGVEFWALEWLDEGHIRFTTRRESLGVLKELARHLEQKVEVERSRGLPELLLRFRRRYGFVVGLMIALWAVAILSRFVLVIEVEGNQRVPTAVILSQLRRSGVRAGVYGPTIDREQAAQEALLELDELAWMGINLHGTRLQVIVREKQTAPEPVDESGFYHVAAETDGLVLHLQAEAGEAVVLEGDTVAAGDILISGTVTIQPPKYSDLPVRTYPTHARGQVWARTWRTLSAVIPLRSQVKSLTGEEINSWYLWAFGRRIEIFGNSSIPGPFYDKITSIHQLPFGEGVQLPVVLVRETLRAYEPEEQGIQRDAAAALLEARLMKRLESLIGEGGEILSAEFSARVEGDLLRVTLVGECREEIGKETPGQSNESGR